MRYLTDNVLQPAAVHNQMFTKVCYNDVVCHWNCRSLDVEAGGLNLVVHHYSVRSLEDAVIKEQTWCAVLHVHTSILPIIGTPPHVRARRECSVRR